jgi:hypothetical protein
MSVLTVGENTDLYINGFREQDLKTFMTCRRCYNKNMIH